MSTVIFLTSLSLDLISIDEVVDLAMHATVIIIACEELVVKRARHLFIIRLVLFHICVTIASTVNDEPVRQIIMTLQYNVSIFVYLVGIEGESVIFWTDHVVICCVCLVFA